MVSNRCSPVLNMFRPTSSIPAKTITGISGVKVDAANDNGKVYDLSGRPAVDAEHGVRIENGKVVIK